MLPLPAPAKVEHDVRIHQRVLNRPNENKMLYDEVWRDTSILRSQHGT